MRMTIILASICAFLVSCATLTGGDSAAPEQTQQQASMDSAAPVPGMEQAPASPDLGMDSNPAPEMQAAQNQESQMASNTEQRSNSEMEAAAPSSGTDNYYASTQPSSSLGAGVEQVSEPAAVPTELPKKEVASWDKHVSAASYADEKPAMKKSKKVAKLHKADKKKIAKHSKKSKKEIAKHSKKAKAVAKNSKKSKAAECKKIAKHAKKATKREIAMCKAEKKKMAAKSKSKHSKVAQNSCQCNYR